MKTETNTSGDIWNNNVDLLSEETCLPVFGTSHVPSILSTLDTTVATAEGGDKVNVTECFDPKHNSQTNIEKNYVVLKDNNISCGKKPNQKNDPNNLEDMLYFVCNLCPFLCTKQAKITEHLQNAHKTKTVLKLPHLKCPACNNVFFHKMSLRSHLIHDHGVGNSDINLIIQAVTYYANKGKSDKKKTNTPCKEVKMKTEKAQQSQPQPPSEPQVKSEKHPEANTITDQKLKKSQSCIVPNCKVTLRNAENMNYHVSCHKGTGFYCLLCEELFNAWKLLISHLWRSHKVDIELYACDQCDYKTVSLAKLNNIHKPIHGDAKTFVCHICSKAFKNNKQLGNHRLRHKLTFEKLKYNCEECGKCFSDHRQVKIHMSNVHKKLKPFSCDFCDYKGSSKSSLKMHIRQHTGEKPFVCDSCSYTTSDHNSLRRHKLRHTGNKPYKCTYCSYACIQSSTFKVHLKTKHPGQEKDLMFTCAHCQFRSVNKEMYQSHMVMVHQEKSPEGLF